ncbi:MAG: Oxygen regulatory protein NreC [Anaerolineales bacterium]|nr:Oxygen regulatory protein NreC [Anaerolineales bacterium]
MTDRIRLIVVDDHTIVREGLISLIEDEPDLAAVGQGGTGRDAVTLARQHRPDIALLDIAMPDMNGLEATREIAAEFPELDVLILTVHEEEAFFFEALRAGAAGYALKGSGSDELLGAIRAVHEGGVYLPPALAGRLVQDYVNSQATPAPDDSLTPREQEVATLIARGLTNRDIAEERTLSINTVKTHRRHIYRKLDLHNRAELVDYALRHGLLTP